MNSYRRTAVAAALTVMTLMAPMAAGAKEAPYRVDEDRWKASEGGFSSWTLAGATRAADGALLLDPATATSETDPYAAGAYLGGNYYNAGSYLVGEALSPTVAADIPFREAIASWNANTPAGTWIETQIRARTGDRFTKFYNLGIWASDSSTVARHSVRAQGDADGYVAVDTLVLDKKVVPDAYQLKVRLFSATAGAVPSLRNLFVTTSTEVTKAHTPPAGNPALWNRVLPVPECSQQVYPDGGNVWCSPVSVSMVMAYWAGDTGPCEPRVRAAVAGVYDWVYDGHGNWPFNTAHAAAAGLEARVTRFTSMAEVEPWIAAGVPVVLSYPWTKNSLDGAPIPSSPGHLAVLVGFDAVGNLIVNDPAAAVDADVQRTYDRTQLEQLWLSNSGGTAYLIHPANHPVPEA